MDLAALNLYYKLSLKKQLILYALMAFILVVINYWLFITPIIATIDREKSRELELKQQYELIVKKRLQLNHIIKHSEQLQQQLRSWKNRVADYKDLPDLLDTILKTSATNNLKISLFNPEEEQKDGDYKKIPINMIAIGSFHEIARFISDIANMQKIVSIQDLTITNENRPDTLGAGLASLANAQNLLTTEINLDIYYNTEQTANEK